MKKFQQSVGRALLALVASLISLSATPAQDETGVTTKLIANASSVKPGETFLAGVYFEVQPGFHFFHRTPGTMGLPTEIKMTATQGTVGPLSWPIPKFDHQPIVDAIDVAYHHSTVVFAPITVPADAKGSVEIEAPISFQFCKEGGNCFPPKPTKLNLSVPIGDSTPSAEKSLFDKAASDVSSKQSELKHAKLEFAFAKKLEPGTENELVLTVVPDQGYKVVASSADSTETTTQVMLTKGLGTPVRSIKLPIMPTAGLDGKTYENPVMFRLLFKSPSKFSDPSAKVQGLLQLRLVNAEGKVEGQTIEFEASEGGSKETTAANTATPTEPSKGNSNANQPGDVAKSNQSTTAVTENANQIDAATDQAIERAKSMINVKKVEMNPLYYYVTAFIAGLILNVMPCVLPVLGIKVIGFVQQAGENRKKILMLNIAHAAGIISVFLLLAAIMIFAKQRGELLGWGSLNQSPVFNVTMAAVVFAMSLSLIGVFEFPGLGFLGSRGGDHHEGPLGAFLMGVFATLLATPCIGPFLSTAVVWSLKQPTQITLIVWFLIGLGMASPYLLFGLSPQAVKLLPRPGNWMVKFKQICGFIMLATVIFIFSYLPEPYLVPSLCLMLVVGMVCWYLGERQPYLFSRGQATIAYALSIAGIAIGSWFSFSYMLPGFEERAEFSKLRLIDKYLADKATKKTAAPETKSESRLDWQPFTTERFEQAMSSGKTVLVDFSAEWCATCKVVEKTALNTASTKQLIDRNQVVTLYADYTEKDPVLTKWISYFGGVGVPLTVIVPSDRSRSAIIFLDPYVQSQLHEALNEAGPSRGHMANR